MRDTPAPIVDLAAKVDFLRLPDAYPERPRSVTTRETHMSFVFLTDGRVYKLKKPVRFPYLDFSTLDRREAACRAELAVNQTLAPTVYRAVVPLCASPGGLRLGGGGRVVDWLVVMRRLAAERMLDQALAAGTVSPRDLTRIADLLAAFYRTARRIPVRIGSSIADWRRRIAENHNALSASQLALPINAVWRVNSLQRRFLREKASLIAARVGGRRVVDGHGDLRPEHISIAEPPAIIDRLEFNPAFREVDPFDELALLSVECEAAGRPAIGATVARLVAQRLADDVDPLLFAFYRSHRAAMRARLAVAHLSEPDGREPEKWRPLALRYLSIATREAALIERGLSAR